MSDFFTAEQIATLSAQTVRVDILLKLEFLSSTFYAWNGNVELTTYEESPPTVWLPMKGFMGIDGLGVTGGGQAVSEAITLSLSGVPDQAGDILALALADTPEVEQQMCTVYLQLFDESWQPTGLPIPVFRGFMQPPKVSRTQMQGVAGSIQSVSMNVENIFYGRARPPYGRYTDADQQARSPGDKFFGFVADAVSKVVVWPDYVILATAGLSSAFALSGANGIFL